MLMDLSPRERNTMLRTLAIAILVATTAACTSAQPTTRRHPTMRTTTTTSTTTTTLPPTTTTTPPSTTTTRRMVPTTTTYATATTTNEDERVPADIRAAVHAHFDEFGTDTSVWMISIIWRESNGISTAWNRASGCRGLTQQALPLHGDLYAAHGWAWEDSWMDVERHLTVAADLYRGSGRAPWAL